MKSTTDGSTSASRSAGVVIRRARPGHTPAPQTLDATTALRREFNALRRQLPRADPLTHARLKARLSEIVRLQKALEAHAHFFAQDRKRLPDDTVH